MMVDQEENPPKNAGLVMINGKRNTFIDCSVSYESGQTGAYIKDEADSKFVNFKVINSSLVHSELDKVERFVEQLPADERERISRPLSLLRNTNSPNFIAAYKEFMSLLGDHVTVVTPLIPYLSNWIAGQSV
ncbi:hypothetical protein ACXH4D_000384 [Klebsiella variicola]|uniref:hypothetical protein n=1 Tax=Klebsiella pneumoniae complex TaxID=3390273 RepID=UPI0014193CDB|nr:MULTISPECIES: hypothetical protein [Klebsiella]EJA2184663.1 hypothetical protein [Klebsiella pneumoniae]EKU6920268.1 hypothetical protein [Klebsiella pneumoniae]EKU6926378.1 hypothetical protein [Klebsiella pneumoniae]EKU7243398.1 hypothetical protein [Klebsiella pneumoniae]EKU7990492.1 hypothetical protein [Klebsiella pneumoniae]